MMSVWCAHNSLSQRLVVLGISESVNSGKSGEEHTSDEAAKAKMEVYLTAWMLEPLINSQRCATFSSISVA